MTIYDDLRTEISTRYKDLSDRLQLIARFALDNPDVIALETIAVISERAGVQPSAVVRFAKAFGFDGFSDMQRLFRSRLVDARPRYRERIQELKRDADKSLKTPDGILAHYVEAGVSSLRQLREEATAEKLERAVRALKVAKTIHIVGQRRSFAPAAYLSYGLYQLGCSCRLIDNIGGMIEQQTRQIARGDAVIAVSFAPYGAETLAVVERAGELGVPVIAITDTAFSPLHGPAAVSFDVEEASVKDFRALSATMCLAVTLIVALGQTLGSPGGRARPRKDETAEGD